MILAVAQGAGSSTTAGVINNAFRPGTRSRAGCHTHMPEQKIQHRCNLPRLAALLLVCAFTLPVVQARDAVPAPEFTQTEADQWINSDPLKMEDLRGKVVLIDVWTFGCGNCRRSIPWLKHLESRFGDESFQIIGIHSPEFPWEKVRLAVVSQTESLGITHPVMLDNDFAYWNALGNRYWPAFYLVNKKGNLVAGAIGEIHIGDRQAGAMEQAIRTQLDAN